MHLLRRITWAVFLGGFFASGLLLTAPASAQTPSAPTAPAPDDATPLWMRYPAISPDGKTIAFAFRGHLFTVPSAGGMAVPLTAGPAHDFQPVWSPDGKTIAYASDAYGNFDVYTIPATGGAAQRLTTHSNDEIPTGFAPDGQSVLFSAHRQDSKNNAQFPSPRVMPELYRVSIEPGHAPEQILTTPALAARYNKAGDKIVYEDLKGYENLWRKHEKASVTHDIWLYDTKTGTHTQLTTFGGEDRNPVWSPDENSVFYLSEQGGSFNVWKLAVEHPQNPVQVTHFDKNPVRFLSSSAAGDLCFGYDGEIYTLANGAAEPKKVPIQIGFGDSERKVEIVDMSDGATEIALNPDGKEIAFVAHGEVFVASTEHGDTKRITNTPTQERSVSFSPDGRRLVFAGETAKSWNLYEASIKQPKEEEPYFFNSTVVDIKPILDNGQENFQPRYSPDGKEVAYLENRTTLKVLNLDSKQSRLILSGDHNYSYSDGDQWFDWSPDGKWFAVEFKDPNRWSSEGGIVDAEGKQQLSNFTNSGYEDKVPSFTKDGKAILWASDREGLHGTGGGEGPAQMDVYALFLNQKAYDRFKLSKAEYEIVKKAEDDAKKDKDKKDEAANGGKPKDDDAKKKEDEDKKKEPVEIEFKDYEDRTERLTINSTALLDMAMTPDGEQLIYLSKNEEGFTVWQNKLREKETKQLATLPESPNNRARGEDFPAQIIIDNEGKTVFVLADGHIAKITLESAKQEPVKFSAEMYLNHSAERAYMFEHAWRQTLEKFYVQNMNGVDWTGYKAIYEKFLPFINNNYDFAEMLSEMLGELNASHTGAGYIWHPGDGDATASLGVFYDQAYKGPGLKVDEIIEKGPLVVAKSKITPGMIIEKIDGETIAADADWCPLLNRKAGKPVLLSVFDPAKNARFDETIKPIRLAEEEELLYQRWIKSRRELVDKLSGGKLGYVHVRAMNDASYRKTFSEILGRESGKQALIVDTRFNGGGNLHDELATLLSGHQYLTFYPRGKVIGEEPTNKWDKRSVVLIGESNYSDAHLFPWTYRALGIGKLIGMPIPGTGTAVWWETQMDPTLYFGIPEVGFVDKKGDYMEHADIAPDIQVANDYQSVATGEDKQLEKAVEYLMSP
jgi:tricorn protease